MSDKQWDKMMSDWQSCKIANNHTPDKQYDLTDLQNKTRKKALSMNCFMWGDIIGAIVITVVFGYLLLQQTDIYKQILYAGSIIIVLPMAFISVWFRRGAWSASGSDTKAYLELALKRSISAIKLAKATMLFCIITGLFFIIVLTLKNLIHPSPEEWPLHRFILAVIAQIIIFGGITYGANRYKLKKQQEKIKLQNMLDELNS